METMELNRATFIKQAAIQICASICANRWSEQGDYSRLKKKEVCHSIAVASVTMAHELAEQLDVQY